MPAKTRVRVRPKDKILRSGGSVDQLERARNKQNSPDSSLHGENQWWQDWRTAHGCRQTGKDLVDYALSTEEPDKLSGASKISR